MVDIVRTNESSEFLAYFPEYKRLYEEVKTKYDHLTVRLQTLFDTFTKNSKNDQEYEDLVDLHKIPSTRLLLREMRTQKVNNVRIFLSTFDWKKLCLMVENEKIDNLSNKEKEKKKNRRSNKDKITDEKESINQNEKRSINQNEKESINQNGNENQDHVEQKDVTKVKIQKKKKENSKQSKHKRW